jgi:hypothetical protein
MTSFTITSETVSTILKQALAGKPVRHIAGVVDLPVEDVTDVLTANGHPDEKTMRRALDRLTGHHPPLREIPKPGSTTSVSASVTVLPTAHHADPRTPDQVITAAQKSTSPKVQRAAARAVKARKAFEDAITKLTDAMGEDREAAALRKQRDQLKLQLANIEAQLRGEGKQWETFPGPRRKPVLPEGVTYKQIRAWAALNDVDCPITGRVPNRVIDAYVHAHSSAGRVEDLHEAAWPTPRPGAEA